MPTQTHCKCFSLEERGDILVVTINIETVIEDLWIFQFGTELNQLLENGNVTKIVINCERVTFYSSAALGKILSLHRKLERLGQALRLCSVRNEIYEDLAVTRLNRTFKIYDDLTAALASFN